MSYGCKCNCATFKDHIGNGPYIAAAATPTRDTSKDTQFKVDTEKRWDKENAAYKRLVAEGHNPPKLNGIDKVEKYATTSLEIERGTVYGKTAKMRERIAKGELAS